MKNAFFCHFFRFCQQWMCCFLECFHLCIKLQQQKANVSPSKSNVTHSNGSSTPLCSYCLSKCLTRLLLCDDLHLCCCVFVQPSSGCCKNSPFSLSFDWLSWLSLSLFCMSTHIRDFHILLFFFFVFWEMQHWRVLRVRLPLSVSSDSKRMLGGDFFSLFFFPLFAGKNKASALGLHLAKCLVHVGPAAGLHQLSRVHRESTFWRVLHSWSKCVNVKTLTSVSKDGWLCMMLIMWFMWCNVTERNKAEWKNPWCGVLLFWETLTCLQHHRVDSLRYNSSSCRLEEKSPNTHRVLLYSSNFKIYWDWLVFANNIQANSSTKHEIR